MWEIPLSWASLEAKWLKKKIQKTLPANVGDTHSFPGLGRSPGEGNGKPHQYSCLENHMDRGAWWACKEPDRTEQLNTIMDTMSN